MPPPEPKPDLDRLSWALAQVRLHNGAINYFPSGEGESYRLALTWGKVFPPFETEEWVRSILSSIFPQNVRESAPARFS